MKRIITVH